MMTILTKISNEHFQGTALAEIPLEQIDMPQGRAPRGLVHSIQTQGLIEPVVLAAPNASVGQDLYPVIAGRRRLQALREIGAETVIAILQAGTLSENAGATLSENLLRSRNLVSEIQAYRDLRRLGKQAEEIQKELGLFKRDVKALAVLASMAPVTESMLYEGRIAPSAAKVLAKLSREDQEAYFAQADPDTGKFTLATVTAWRKNLLFSAKQMSFLADIPYE